MYRRGFYSHHNHDAIIGAALASLNGNTQGFGFMRGCPQGSCWYVERWTQHIAHTAVFELAVMPSNATLDVTVWDKTGRVDWAATSVDAKGDLAAPIYVGPGEYLCALWSSGTAADVGLASFQIAVHKLELENVSMAHASHEPEGETVIEQPEGEHRGEEAHTGAIGVDLLRSFDAAI